MIEQDHTSFPKPADLDVKVWRYLDFGKYVSFLETSSLWFARADKLGDPFEGSIPAANARQRAQMFEDIPNISPEGQTRIREHLARQSGMTKMFTRSHGVCCWHENEFESAAMWDLYVRTGQGIAVQSTFRRLRDSLTPSARVYLGKVTYVDYASGAIREGNVFDPFMHKRKSFEHEREIRGVIAKWPDIEEFTPDGCGIKGHGIEIAIDMSRLVERVHLAPRTPGWFSSAVEAVTRRFSYGFPIEQSSLDADPIY